MFCTLWHSGGGNKGHGGRRQGVGGRGRGQVAEFVELTILMTKIDEIILHGGEKQAMTLSSP